MWRFLARRAWLRSVTDVSKLHSSAVEATVPAQVVVISSPYFLQSASRVSEISHFHRTARFFSSNSSETYEDPQFEASENAPTTGGFSIDNDWVEEKEGFPEVLDSLADTSAGLGSLEIEDEGVGQENQNDLGKVEALFSLLQSRGVFHGALHHHLEEMNLVLSEALVLKVLETPQVPGENLISFMSWVLKKEEIQLTAAILGALTSALCLGNRKRESFALWGFLKEAGLKKRDALSSQILNEMIALFSRVGEAKAAYDVFNGFEELGCSMTGDTYFLTIEALCRRSLYDLTCSVSEQMLSADKLPAIDKVGKIISYLCKGDRTRDAHLVYLYVKDKKMNPSGSLISRLIYSFSRLKRADKGDVNREGDKSAVSSALELLNDYSTEDRRNATRPFTKVIKKLCWIEDVDRGKTLIHEMISSGPPPGNDAFNCVINGLSKTGEMDEALNMMNLMKQRGLKPDVYTYSTVMSGFTKAGEMEKACEVFEEVKRNHSKLSPVTFHMLIRGFCKVEQFDKAVKLLREMKQHGVRPSHDEYNKLIKSLCFKALDWKTAEKLEEEMKANGVILNGRTSALVAAVKELKG